MLEEWQVVGTERRLTKECSVQVSWQRATLYCDHSQQYAVHFKTVQVELKKW